jgi:hypothetical protein
MVQLFQTQNAQLWGVVIQEEKGEEKVKKKK